MRRIPFIVVTAVLWLVLLATPADAHSSGDEASNFLTRLQSVEPSIPGLDVDIVEHGQRIEVTNRTDRAVVVLGYQDEPYLRIRPDGVEENLRSPTTYVNRDRQGTTAVPGSADPQAEPEWSAVSDSNTVRWHDHRIHWMGSASPPEVASAPDERHTIIPEWVVPLRVGDTPVEARGDLVWVPGPSPWPWFALAAASFAAALAAVLSRHWRPLAVVGIGALVAIDAGHVLGVVLGGADGFGREATRVLPGSLASIVGWIAGVAALVLLVSGSQRRPQPRTALVALALAGVLVAFNGGIADLAVLSRSQVLFAWADGVARAMTAVSLGLGLGLLAGAGVRLYRAEVPETASTAAGAGHPV